MAVYNAVFVALVLSAHWKALPAERVHFRIYTTDLLDQHTHTRTVFLKPEKRGAWNDKGGPQAAFTFGQYSQKNEAPPLPLTVSTSTMYYPPVLLKTTKYVPHPSQMHKPRPVRLVHPHQLPPPSSIIYSPPAPSLDPQRYAPLRGSSQISQPGCGAFVEGSENVEKGNCFVEQYENGYRDEESRKTFFGDGNTNVNTEKHGERNSQNYRNEAVYHHDSKHRIPPPAGNGQRHRDEAAYHHGNPPSGRDHYHGGRVKVKEYRTRNHYSDRNRVRTPANQDDRRNDHSYRQEGAYHYPDNKRIPIPEKNENSLAPQAEVVPPKKGDDEVDEEVPAKAVYFKPLKNGKVKFIVRPSDIKYVKVHDASNIKPGDDVKLVEITKSRKVVPSTGTKIDTVKIVENTEPLPEEDAHSEESETEGTRKVRQKSHKSKGPVKTFKNVKVREKITRLVGPKKSAKSESKVNPLWVQESSDPGAESGEADDEKDNDNFDASLEGDSLDDDDDDDGYRVHEEQAEASEVPSPMLTSPAEKSVLRVRSRGRKPRRDVKYAIAAPQASFEDSWVAAQTEISKKINEYWHGNPGDIRTSSTGTLFGGTDMKSSSFAGTDKTIASPGFSTSDTKPRVSLFDNEGKPSSLESSDAIGAGLPPRSFGTPFKFAISDSSEKNGGKLVNDLFAPSTMEQEFYPSDKNHPVANGLGKSEQAIAGGVFEHSAEEIFEEMLPLAKIIASKGLFKDVAAPTLPKDSFGASDPDRLESDVRAVPVVEESSHKRKGYKETRQQQLKSWR